MRVKNSRTEEILTISHASILHIYLYTGCGSITSYFKVRAIQLVDVIAER